MASTMVEPPLCVASTSHKPLSRMPSTKTLNSATPAGARPKLSRSATVASKPTSRSPKTSPGRGLTLRIEDDMHIHSMQSIQSAPAKAIRRLPPLPVPPLPSHDIVPHTAPVDHDSGAAQAFRTVRPLPSPPTMPIPHRTPIRHSSPGYKIVLPSSPSSPTRKPLPVPKSMDDRRPASEETRIRSHRQTLPNLPRRTETPPPMPPLPSVISKIPGNVFRNSQEVDEDDPSSPMISKIPGNGFGNSQEVDEDYPSSPISDIDVEEGVIQLGNHIVLRKASTISLRLEPMSDDEEDKVPPVPPLPSYIPDMVPKIKEEKEDDIDHIDYTWVLSNRTLYRQQSPQFQSKWVREKKGKRYTEQDYENIIQALRSL